VLRIVTCTGRRSFLLLSLWAALSTASAQDAGDDAPVPGWREEFAREYELPRDYGHDWRLGSMFGYTPEDGLLIGTGAILYEFGFRTYPYVYRMSLTAGISIPTLNYRVVYTLQMPALGQQTSLDLYAHASALEIRNFYGYGNDSPRNETLEEDGYYRIPSREFWIRPTIFYSLGDFSRIGLGVWLKQFRVRSTDGKILTQADLDSLGDDRATAGIGARFIWDSRDQEAFTTSGVLARLEGWHYGGLVSSQAPFQRISLDVRLYAGIPLPEKSALALRFGGERLWGDYPFYESAFLGGGTSLRGYLSQRFSGDAMAFGSAELRLRLGRWRVLVPSEFGITVFGDAGRVWFEKSSPGSWHADAGVGLWAAPVFREFLFSFSLASSVEGLFLHATTGMSF